MAQPRIPSPGEPAEFWRILCVCPKGPLTFLVLYQGHVLAGDGRVRGEKRSQGRWGRESVAVLLRMTRGWLEHLPRPPQQRLPGTLVCAQLWLSLEGFPPQAHVCQTSPWAGFQGTRPAGPALPPVSSVTLKKLLLHVGSQSSHLLPEGADACSVPELGQVHRGWGGRICAGHLQV